MVNNLAEKRNRTVSWIGRPIRQREMSDGTTNIQVLVEERRTLPVRWSETAASDLARTPVLANPSCEVPPERA